MVGRVSGQSSSFSSAGTAGVPNSVSGQTSKNGSVAGSVATPTRLESAPNNVSVGVSQIAESNQPMLQAASGFRLTSISSSSKNFSPRIPENSTEITNSKWSDSNNLDGILSSYESVQGLNITHGASMNKRLDAALINAIRTDDPELLVSLDASGQLDVNRNLIDEDANLLIFAGREKASNVMTWLLHQKLELDETESGTGYTALHHCLLSGMNKEAEALIQLGARTDIADDYDLKTASDLLAEMKG